MTWLWISFALVWVAMMTFILYLLQTSHDWFE